MYIIVDAMSLGVVSEWSMWPADDVYGLGSDRQRKQESILKR
jgi:hypothetical protein